MSNIRIGALLSVLLIAMQAGAEAVSSLPVPDVHADSSHLRLSDLPALDSTSKTNKFSLLSEDYFNSSAPAFRGDALGADGALQLAIDDGFQSTRGWSGRADVSDKYSFGERWNYLDVLDLHIGADGKSTSVSAGRKLDTWADWDEEWKLGVFQPRYTEEGLRLKEAGLTGFFYRRAQGEWSFAAGALPVFIPDMGPHISVKNDQLTSSNPWFAAPPSQFLLQDTNTVGDLHYKLDADSPEHIVAHPGGVVKLERQAGRFASRLSFAYKPMNQFVVSFPSDHPLKTGSTDYILIDVVPRVVYERVTSIDQKYSTGSWEVSASAAYDSPVQDRGDPSTTSQQVADAWIVAGSVSRRLEIAGPHAAQWKVGFLKVNGGDEAATGRFAGTGGLFARRFQFYEAYFVALKGEYRGHLRFPVETEARAIYDRMQGGGVFSLTSAMNLSSRFRAELELDVLGLLRSDAPIQDDGFLSMNRANDRVGLGMSYVF